MFIGLVLETEQADAAACYLHKENTLPSSHSAFLCQALAPNTLCHLQQSQVPLWTTSIHWNTRKHTRAFCQVGLLLFCWVNLTHRRICRAPDPAQETSQAHICVNREGEGVLSAGTRGKPLSNLSMVYHKKRSAICETTTPLHTWLINSSSQLRINLACS